MQAASGTVGHRGDWYLESPEWQNFFFLLSANSITQKPQAESSIFSCPAGTELHDNPVRTEFSTSFFLWSFLIDC